MKNSIRNLVILIAFLFTGNNCYSQYGEAQFPSVKSYGGIYSIPFATVSVDPELSYKIVIEVKMGSEAPDRINPALNNIARMMNLHVLAGVKSENLEVVAIVHGLATTSITNNEGYQKHFGVDNPNLNLINELKSAGAKIIICGQSMRARNVEQEELAEGVEVAISMLTALTTYQLRGFAALQF